MPVCYLVSAVAGTHFLEVAGAAMADSGVAVDGGLGTSFATITAFAGVCSKQEGQCWYAILQARWNSFLESSTQQEPR